GRPGSIIGLVAPATPAGASADLWTLADRRAVAVVDEAAPAVGRLLARDTRTSLYAAAGVAVLGAALFVAASPGAGRVAPWRRARAARGRAHRVLGALHAARLRGVAARPCDHRWRAARRRCARAAADAGPR